ncbi:hypothetical protein ASPBRDRAFT_60100 [Aspergillus brasiliensis CBS 101740]|uniref:Uncharacterized protein n=1 Tax=Aspergillus brasiliensis (strain CBS 101740 / IMI 381727 / IBT 21946) TaxID=767769 RepID=A0A1L9U2P5_ASPBC|nr:hypothetical protein ASPBRDRAFT_60100 [Aspergillus brasiliensis CBS 101740]
MITIGLDPGNRTRGMKSPIRTYHGLSEQLYLGPYSQKAPRTTPTRLSNTNRKETEAKPSDPSLPPSWPFPRVPLPYVFATFCFNRISYGTLRQDSLGRELAVNEAIYLFCQSANKICARQFH